MLLASGRIAKDAVSVGNKNGHEGLDLLQYVTLHNHREVWLRGRFCKQTFDHLNASLLFHLLELLIQAFLFKRDLKNVLSVFRPFTTW